MSSPTEIGVFAQLYDGVVPPTATLSHTKETLLSRKAHLVSVQAAIHKGCSKVIGDAVGGEFVVLATAPKGRFEGVDTWAVAIVVSDAKGAVTVRGLKGHEFDRLAEHSYGAVHSFGEEVARQAATAQGLVVDQTPHAWSKGAYTLQVWAQSIAEGLGDKPIRRLSEGGFGLMPNLWSSNGWFSDGGQPLVATPAGWDGWVGRALAGA